MSIPIDSIQTIFNRIISDIEGELGITIPPADKSAFRVQALAYAAEIGLLQHYAADASQQRFPQTANEQFLEILGGLKGITRKAGQPWRGQCETEATGTGTIPAGKSYIYAETGIVYTVDIGVTIIPGTLTLDLTATWDFLNGEITTRQNGDELDISGAIPGLSSIATVTSTTQDGADVEDIEDYRERVIDAYRLAPQGGAAADYVIWGSEPVDVISIFPYSADFAGAVNVYVEVGDQPDGIPTQAQLDAVLESIKLDEEGRARRRPVTATVYTLPIEREDFDVEIQGLDPDNQDVRDSVEFALANQLLSYTPYIEGITVTRNDRITSAGLVAAAQAGSAIQNATFSNLVIRQALGITNSYVLEEGEKSKLGTTIYVA